MFPFHENASLLCRGVGGVDEGRGPLWPPAGAVVGAFKSLVTVSWRNHHKSIGLPCNRHLWQRDYYEHVIRNEDDLHLTREYIVNNPLEALLQQERRYEELKKAKMPNKR